MSFPPGVRLPMTRPLYATSSVRPGTMMVQMAPVRPVTMVPVSQVMVRPVMRPVISQSQAAFVSAMQTQAVSHVLTNQPILQTTGQQLWIQSAEPQKSAIISRPPELRKEIHTPPQQHPDTATEPAITVFVGNITDRASDTLIRQILMKCGSVYAWKRVQGPSGKLQAFGFCEYRDPESALRAMHILHNYTIGDKKLLVKVDAKTQELIDEWKKKKGMKIDDNESSKLSGVKEAMSGIENLVLGYSNELAISKPAEEKDDVTQALKPELMVRESRNVEENLDELQLEEDQKNFISKEIRSFRESQKQQEERYKSIRAEKARNRDILPRDRARTGRNEHEDRSRRTRSPRNSNRRSRSVSPRSSDLRRSPPRRRSRTPPRALLIRRISPRRSPRRRSRSPPARRRRSSSRSPSWRRDDKEDTEEKRRKFEKKIKEKESTYQERLSTLENRERRQKRAHEKRDREEKVKREGLVKEAKKLREFLADYDDEKCDNKYYAGTMLTKRLSEREREMEEDAQDRKREAEEISILKKRLVEENHTSPDAAIASVIAETEEIWRSLIEPDTPPGSSSSPVTDASSSSDDDSDSNKSESDDSEVGSVDSDDQSVEYETEIINEEPTADIRSNSKTKPELTDSFSSADSPSSLSSSGSSPQKFKTNFKLKQQTIPIMNNSKRRKFTVSEVFNQDEDEDVTPRKKRMTPLQSLDGRNSRPTDEKKLNKDKRKLVRNLIEKIPTEKDDIFDYTVLWSMVDTALIDKRIKPWISKKIIEYIGEEEPTLVEFICSKISSKSSPGKILDDISMVLDEEAEVFIVKLWRLLIYETEAKNEGLTK